MTQSPFEIPASWEIWDSKYRYREGSQVFDDTIEDTWSRIARTLAQIEGGQQKFWTRAFLDILQDFRFLSGVLFIDRINQQNNLAYRENITATNPCGEVPLPPYGACNLGSLNLTRFVQRPFTGEASLDLVGMRDTVRTAVRMLDNVIDVSHFAMEKQAEQARGARRIGLGFTGLGDALIMLGIRYGVKRVHHVPSKSGHRYRAVGPSTWHWRPLL